MDWSDLAFRLLEMLLPIAAAFVIALIGYGISLIKQKTDAIQAEDLRQEIGESLDFLHSTIATTVDAISQETVDDLKALREDGKLTEEEKAQFKRQAVERVMASMSQTTKDILEYVVGNLTEYVQSVIEAYIKDKAAPKPSENGSNAA